MSLEQRITALEQAVNEAVEPNDLTSNSAMPTGGKVVVVNPSANEFQGVSRQDFVNDLAGDKLDRSTYTGNAQDLADAIQVASNGVRPFTSIADANTYYSANVPTEDVLFIVTEGNDKGEYTRLSATNTNSTKRPLPFNSSDVVLDLSPNLAKDAYLVYDEFIASNGQKFAGAGWVMLKIPVTNNQDYTFGNFTIDSVGYSAFYNDADALVQNNGNHTNATLPKTVSATSVNATWLYIDIARPSNSPTDYNRSIVNEGATLIDYVEPIDYIESIGGNSVKAGGIEDGTDASLGALTVLALTLDIPQGAGSPPVQVEIGDAWIDTSNNNSIQVKLT